MFNGIVIGYLMFNGIVIGGHRLDKVIAKTQQPTAADRPFAHLQIKSNHVTVTATV